MAGFAMLIDSNIVYKFNIINFIDFYIKFMRMYFSINIFNIIKYSKIFHGLLCLYLFAE